jgi:5-methyltetrahydropteroyltriglutamate--homocysteine methyltransferase
MGPNRELKFALEKHWKGLIDEKELLNVAHSVESQAWSLQETSGIDRVSVGDHYLYDGILAWTEMLGCVPKRFQGLPSGTARLFAMARGIDGATALSKFIAMTRCHHSLTLSEASHQRTFSVVLPRHEKVDHQQLPLHGPRV